jgi:P-nitrobenzoate reductase
LGRFFVYFAGVLGRSKGFHVGSFAHLLMLAGILRCGYDSVTYENVQYPNKVRAHPDIPDNEIALAGIVLGYRSDGKVNSHRSPRSSGRGDFKDHIRRE